MIGLVLVTHGRLAAEFITAMEHVVGPQEAIEGICIDADDDMEMRRKDIADAIQRCDQGKGVIILTDLFGGTPSNLAISLMKSENIEVIAGVNLPMLIRLEGARKAMTRPRRGRRRARSGAQIYLGRERNPRRGGGLSCSRVLEITNRRGLHARASAKFVNLAAELPAKVEVEKDGNRVVRHLDHGADDARRGDGRHDHAALRRRRLRRRARPACSALVDGALRRRLMPREITSFSNDTVKRLRALRDKKARREDGLFLAEGLRILAEARDSGRLPEIIAYSPTSGRSTRSPPTIIAAVRGRGRATSSTPAPTSSSKMSGKDNPQAILGAYRQPDTSLAAIDRTASPLWLVAQALRDPGNIGTILRTGDATGAGGLILIDDSADPYSVEAVRASMGAIFTQAGRDRDVGRVPAVAARRAGAIGRDQPQHRPRLSRRRPTSSPASC